MPFKNNNVAVGLPSKGQFQVGKSDVDPDISVERKALIPYVTDPAGSYVYYDCTVGVMLDSGIVVHNRLPQVNKGIDSLSSVGLDDPKIDQYTAIGVNLRCQDQYADIVQRMGHSRYWFRLWGQALRVGFQVPIPGIIKIGNVPAIPYDKNPQWAFNRISPGGNYSGVILWHAGWSLWYTTAVPPQSNTIPAVDLAAFIRGDVSKPEGMQVPFAARDDDATTTGKIK